jgi:hypothetical protein
MYLCTCQEKQGKPLQVAKPVTALGNLNRAQQKRVSSSPLDVSIDFSRRGITLSALVRVRLVS